MKARYIHIQVKFARKILHVSIPRQHKLDSPVLEALAFTG